MAEQQGQPALLAAAVVLGGPPRNAVVCTSLQMTDALLWTGRYIWRSSRGRAFCLQGNAFHRDLAGRVVPVGEHWPDGSRHRAGSICATVLTRYVWSKRRALFCIADQGADKSHVLGIALLMGHPTRSDLLERRRQSMRLPDQVADSLLEA